MGGERAASSPAGHGHLYARGRDGRAQLVQVPNARSAGVAAVHLERRRRGLVRRPHPELGQTEGALGAQLPTDGDGGGGWRQRKEAEAARAGRGGRRRTSAPAAWGPRASPGEAGAAGEVGRGLCDPLPALGVPPGPVRGCRRTPLPSSGVSPSRSAWGLLFVSASAHSHPPPVPRLLSIRCGPECHAVPSLQVWEPLPFPNSPQF